MMYPDLVAGMNCEKNAVVCEGYPEKQIWKSGKERAEEGNKHPGNPVFIHGQKLILNRAAEVAQLAVHHNAAYLLRPRHR